MAGQADGIEVRPIRRSEVPQAASVLGSGMRDNPLHVAALGINADARVRRLTGVFRAFLALEEASKGRVLGAYREGNLVGVCGMMAPGRCQLAVPEKIALLPGLVRHCGLAGTGKLLAQFGAWSRHDPAAPHWHLGPVGVLPELQGQGIGSQLLRAFCRIVEEGGQSAWLETDKEINVAFYRRHGFEVVAEDTVNGVPNWFMERKAGA